ncbi:MAG: phage portal protein [Actinomycetia bacterium]|nr:phage portal protein [Actinomycetes bacterium]
MAPSLIDYAARAWRGPQVSRADFPAVSPPSVQVSGLGELLGWGPSTALSERMLLSIPAVFSSLDLIASVGASFPVNVTTPAGDVLAGEQLPPVVARPDPSMSRYQAVQGWLFNLGLSGRLWWHRVTAASLGAAGDPTTIAVRMLDPHRVRARYESPRSSRIIYTWNGEISSREQLKQIGWQWIAGEAEAVGPLQLQSTVLSGIIGANERALSVFTEDGTPPVVLSTDQRLAREQVAQELAHWEERHRGVDRTALMTGGVTAVALQHDNRLQQWDEARNFGVLEVGRMFHFPEHLLHAATSGSSLTYSNVSQVAVDLLRFAVQPFLDRLEDAWSEQLEPGWRVRFDTSTYSRADFVARIETYAKGIDAEIWEPGEVREWEGLDQAGNVSIGMTPGVAE